MDDYKKKKTIIAFTSFGVACLCMLLIYATNNYRYLPDGMVIDETFLNTLKWMTAAKYVALIIGIILIFLPYIIWQFKFEKTDGQKKILVMSLIALTILTALIVINGRKVVGGINKTPSVVQKTVTEMKKGGKRKGKTIYFDDGTFAHPSQYQFNMVRKGDKVYVVYVEQTAIGVFRADDYTLAVPESK